MDEKDPVSCDPGGHSTADELFEILGRTADGVFAVDRGQRIAFWNDAAQQILGFEANAVLGKPCYQVLGGTDEGGCNVCEKRCATFRASLRGELSPTRDLQAHTSAGGSKWINVTTFVVPSRYHELALLAHVFRDESEIHKLQSRLERVVNGEEGDLCKLADPLDSLTGREKEILRLLAAGRSTTSICADLGVARTTVRTHVQRILEKIGVHSRLEAVAYASRNGWLRSAND